ncbi:GNAT family N-acetyltransferase [Halosegnis sp.]|uniref:GNAT family N-acetyltransferase n=1 Tax=Halosegnis sp. TaxID=2864959 RepID=UPI0035D4B089
MNVREADESDADAIRTIARSSMEASYSLSPETIRGAVKSWYDDKGVVAKLADDDVLLLVGETDEGIVGFSESTLVDARGDILWLHTDPMFRGEGLGEELFSATKQALEERGADTIRGLVLDDNREGNDFYDSKGFHRVGDRRVEIDGTDYTENIYAEKRPPGLATVQGTDGRQLYVDRSDSDRGSKGPFRVVYSDEDREDAYGYLCDNCQSLVVAMDSMGKMECESCGNVRKPTRWDATYM